MSSRDKNLVIVRAVVDQGLRHLGIGRAHAGQPVLLLIHDQHVVTSHAATGEVLAEHHIDPTKDYQRPTPNGSS